MVARSDSMWSTEFKKERVRGMFRGLWGGPWGWGGATLVAAARLRGCTAYDACSMDSNQCQVLPWKMRACCDDLLAARDQADVR